MKGINTALIGCGRIGFMLESDPLRYKPCTHYGGAHSAGISINAACDINTARLRTFQHLAGIPEQHLYTDYNDLITALHPEIVIIATWTDSHVPIGIAAAESGAKVIVCEKPIAPDLKEAQRLIDACERNRTELIINHERRFDHRYRTIRNFIVSGKIGEIKTVHASILTSGYRGKSDIREGGGPLLQDGTHLIDIIRFLFGDITSVSGSFARSGRKSGFEDRAAGWLKAGNNIDIFLEAGGNRHYFHFELDIYGTEGRIVIGNGYEKLFVSKKSTLYKNFRDLKEKPVNLKKGVNCFTREYREVKRFMQRGERSCTSTGQDGYKALEAVHALYLSGFSGKKIDLPVKQDSIDLRKIFTL
ncbi:MAG TPA: Gfo/Idh/MocA family oxidoreductase [Spirochaetota bacterium]|nr:Gfo/Idh/MocA family oxidoreductase [Spirochaetota bacterium]HPQ52003.1 Gfo/Idh/MocA family oxidoreductase [Spirochaetota bacterium]